MGWAFSCARVFLKVGQSLGSLAFAAHALLAALPDTFVDTTGAAFSLPLARAAFGCSCAAYVHYPTISTDMLKMVFSRRPSYNHGPHCDTHLNQQIDARFFLFAAFERLIFWNAAGRRVLR